MLADNNNLTSLFKTVQTELTEHKNDIRQLKMLEAYELQNKNEELKSYMREMDRIRNLHERGTSSLEDKHKRQASHTIDNIKLIRDRFKCMTETIDQQPAHSIRASGGAVF